MMKINSKHEIDMNGNESLSISIQIFNVHIKIVYNWCHTHFYPFTEKKNAYLLPQKKNDTYPYKMDLVISKKIKIYVKTNASTANYREFI